MKLENINAILLAICVIFLPSEALAHKMLVDALVNEDGTVQIEAFFPDGSPARNTKIEVFSPDGNLFKEGTTNSEGQFITTLKPGSGTWKTVATGKMGHKTSTKFKILTGVETEATPESTVVEEKTKPEENRLAHKEALPLLQIISGFGFIFGISAFIMCLKLRADLSRLKNASTGN